MCSLAVLGVRYPLFPSRDSSRTKKTKDRYKYFQFFFLLFHAILFSSVCSSDYCTFGSFYFDVKCCFAELPINFLGIKVKGATQIFHTGDTGKISVAVTVQVSSDEYKTQGPFQFCSAILCPITALILSRLLKVIS